MATLRRDRSGASLIDAFRTTVDVHGHRPAIHLGHRELSYRWLAAKAFGLGRLIASRRETAPEPIVTLMSQGPGAIVAALAVLSTGKFYIPIDPFGPTTHLRAVLESTRPSIILCEPEHAGAAAALTEADVIVVDVDDTPTAREPVATEIDPDSPATVYFTSGSTGAPKGVVDSHRNVLDNARRYASTLGFAPDDRMSLLQTPAISAVMSTMFGALATGASMVPIEVVRETPEDAVAKLIASGTTIFHAVPFLLRVLTDSGLGRARSLRLIRLEGDRASSADVEVIRRSFESRPLIVNGLGITETGLVSQYFVEPGDSVEPGPLPVGFAVPGVEVSVDRSPAGDLTDFGEVVVESDHLAIGYWNDEARTRDRFRSGAKGRRYHTGDLGRFDAAGRLHLMGRADDLVKIRGVQVNPAAIESLIMGVPGVTMAVVSLADDGDGSKLEARVSLEGTRDVPVAVIRQAILSNFPPAALPKINFVDVVETTRVGKIARSRQVGTG